MALALAALAILAWQPLQCAIAYAERAAAFPVLAQGLHAADLYFLQAHGAGIARAALPSKWSRAGEGPALRLAFKPGARPALELSEPAADWRGHDVLVLDITNPDSHPLSFTLRIEDARHDWSYEDRLNLPLEVPAATRITARIAVAAIETAPAHRRMDLAHIANVLLFSRAPAQGTEFYVSRLALE